VTQPAGRDGAVAQRFVEAMGLYFEDRGVPRIGGRLLGLLLLADGPLSLDQIAATLRVSRASVSTNARLLLTAGLIERVSLPGDRRDYYTFGRRAWEGNIQAAITRARTFQRIAAEGLAALGPGDSPAHARLREAVELGDFYATGLTALLERWQARAPAARRPGGRDDESAVRNHPHREAHEALRRASRRD
jgi:DNA-binding Lrp family transcriptional regulator